MNNLLIAVPLIGPSLYEYIDQARRAVSQRADILEVRLDYLEPDIDFTQLPLLFPQIPKIITNRHKDEAGGDTRAGWKGKEEERIRLLERFAVYNPAYIDMELAHFVPLKLQRRHTKLIVSYHNFDSTPPNSYLDTVFQRALDLGADIVKIATQANNESDATRLLEFIATHTTKNKLIAVGMGEHGKKTRIEGPRLGNYLTYACLDNTATAPGQLTIEELRVHWNS